MLQGRGLGIIDSITQSTRPVRDNLAGGLSGIRRGARQATSGLGLDTVKQVRENVRTGLQGQQSAVGAAATAAPVRGMFSFQTREFVEQTGARPAAPSRPVEGRIVVRTGL